MWYNHIVFFFNKKHWAKYIVLHRKAICQTCPFYDEKGTSENVILKGFPACSICGCNINEKTACLSCHCALKDEGIKPHWDVITKKDVNKLEKSLSDWGKESQKINETVWLNS